MQAFFDSLMQHDSIWGARVFMVVLATASVGLLVHWIIGRLTRRTAHTPTSWNGAALVSAKAPLQALIWVLGLNLAAQVIRHNSKSELFDFAQELRAILVIVIIAWFLLRFVRQVEHNLTQTPEGEPSLDITNSSAISKLLRITVVITAALILLERLGYSISGVLAFGGIGGLAVGFAAKDLLANFFGGLMIFLDRPFNVGDWVRSPDREIEGTVEHIGWRITVIRTFDMRPLYVPNATFMTIAVENPGRMSFRRMNESIGVRYEDWQKVPGIIADIRKMLEVHDGIAEGQPMVVNFNRFNDSSLELLVSVFSHTRDRGEFHVLKQDILFKVMQIIDAHGAQIAFPSRMMYTSPQPKEPDAPAAAAKDSRV